MKRQAVSVDIGSQYPLWLRGPIWRCELAVWHMILAFPPHVLCPKVEEGIERIFREYRELVMIPSIYLVSSKQLMFRGLFFFFWSAQDDCGSVATGRGRNGTLEEGRVRRDFIMKSSLLIDIMV